MVKILSSKSKITAHFLGLWGVWLPVVVILGHIPIAQAQEVITQPMINLPTSDTGYTLGPGDLLQLDIFNVPEYSGNNGHHQVSIDGSVNLPLIGNISVQGMTVDQVTVLIQQRYGEYLQRPILALKLIAARPLQVAVTGEVQRPGSYIVSPSASMTTNNPLMGTPEIPGAGGRLPTITRVLQMAGGITPSADMRQVKIRRAGGTGGERIMSLDLWELLQTGDLRQDITLRDGDTIYIPTATEHNAAESSQLITANFASNNNQPINVAVVGAVNRPGTHTLVSEAIPRLPAEPGQPTEGLGATSGGLFTVTKALKMAGGITPGADIRNIQVRRLTRTGTEQQITVDLWKLLQEGDLSQDAMLQQGDTIVVPTATTAETEQNAEVVAASFSPDTLKISLVGEVVSPGAKSLTPNTSLNQALVEAGGFNESRANKKQVELIRIHPNGTVSRRQIPINLSAEVNEETNPTLRNNDVIVVGRSGGAAFREGLGTVLNSLSPINNFLGLFRFVNILN
ncbi:SLBB domain-containing protein [Planktothrix paucivesiculata]|uniref:Polysaccharide export protein n=1 Tax=Planktothrix paucivesiculata PCC 9631 TaxID=671071 RepID=A0A7Z9BVW7_9CYAN|nr:SLBB domain-containing protein [Planktothrix paucivesiculata]VXD23258.1 conserved exported hypothetical protein [Planktothrix paucivesiculata PCC 9631]